MDDEVEDVLLIENYTLHNGPFDLFLPGEPNRTIPLVPEDWSYLEIENWTPSPREVFEMDLIQRHFLGEKNQTQYVVYQIVKVRNPILERTYERVEREMERRGQPTKPAIVYHGCPDISDISRIVTEGFTATRENVVFLGRVDLGPGVLTDAEAVNAVAQTLIHSPEPRRVYALIALKALLGEVPPLEDLWPPPAREPHQLRHCALLGWPCYYLLLKNREHCLPSYVVLFGERPRDNVGAQIRRCPRRKIILDRVD